MKILIANQIDPDAERHLGAHHDVIATDRPPPEELRGLIVDREAVILRSGVQLSAEVMAGAPDLRLVIRAGSGLDNIDRDYIASNGITLERIPGPAARSVAELTFGLMLAVKRRILEADRSMRDARWLKSQLAGRTLDGKVLGIIGVGNIGSMVARLGVAWGMKVIGCVGHPSVELAATFKRRGMRLVDINEVLERSDVVTIHVPLKEDTVGLIGKEELALMKRGSVLLNLSRGGVVDEGALLNALKSGHLAGAGVDVHVREGDGERSPLADLPNVVLTPHLGSTTVDTQRQIGAEIVRIVRNFRPGSRRKPGAATAYA